MQNNELLCELNRCNSIWPSFAVHITVSAEVVIVFSCVAIFFEIYCLFLSQSDVSLVKGQIHPWRAMMDVWIINEKL